jgi:hypothetical protein
MGSIAEDCAPGETASLHPSIRSVASPCATALGKGPARTGAAPATAAPAGKEAPKKESGIEQTIKGVVGK